MISGSATEYAVKTDGTVWARGYNGNAQLGDGTTTDSHIPVQVTGITGAIALTTPGNGGTAYAVLQDGTIRAWGNNHHGQLGNGTTTDSHIPVQVTGITGATALSTTDGDTTNALMQDGTVRAWGNNSFGQLGNGTTTDSSVPVQVTGITGATALSTNDGYTTYALMQDGTVRAWGNNVFGELGNGTTTDSSVPVQVTGITGITSLATWSLSTYALMRDGTIRAWGRNSFGQLGNGTTTDSSVPVQVTGLTGASALTPGNGAAYALLPDGTVRAWGDNGNGQLGNGTTTNSNTPVQVGVASGP